MYTQEELTKNEKQLDEVLEKIGDFTKCQDKDLISTYYRLEQKNRAIVDYLDKKKADQYLAENIDAAKDDFNKAVEVYKNYVGKAETDKERERRINQMRCG